MAHQKLAILTGATGGIGRVLLRSLHDAGYAVIACLHTTPLVEDLDCCAATCTLDLATMSSGEMSTRLSPVLRPYRFRVDLLVTAHGAAPVTTPTVQLDTAQVETIYRTDVLGTLALAQAVAPYMLAQQWGAMVFVSSIHARLTYPARAGYAAAKAALGGMVRSLALEWGPSGVTVNAVLPWQVEGPRTSLLARQAARTGTNLLRLYKQRSPLGRLVSPNDVAKTVLWLADTPSITGQEIVVDCGVSASMWFQPFPVEVPDVSSVSERPSGHS